MNTTTKKNIMTFKKLTKKIRDCERTLLPNNKRNVFQDYVADCFLVYDCLPWNESIVGLEVPKNFVDYWLSVIELSKYE
jgi:hypothetical protein